MPHSNVVNLLHLVWSTHRRKNTIPEEILDPLGNYFIGIGYKKRIPVIAAGGMRNHVHLAVELPPTMKLAYALSVFKANSSRWLREQGVRDFLADGIWRVQLRYIAIRTGKAIHSQSGRASQKVWF